MKAMGKMLPKLLILNREFTSGYNVPSNRSATNIETYVAKHLAKATALASSSWLAQNSRQVLPQVALLTGANTVLSILNLVLIILIIIALAVIGIVVVSLLKYLVKYIIRVVITVVGKLK